MWSEGEERMNGRMGRQVDGEVGEGGECWERGGGKEDLGGASEDDAGEGDGR